MFELKSDEARLLLNIALMAVGGNRFQTAETILAALDRFRPHEESLASARAVLLLSAQDFQGALDFIDRIGLVRFPDSAMLQAFKGMAYLRMDRVNEEFKKEISKIIDQDLKNPNITGLISVTKVKTSPDLKSAKIFVSILGSKSKKNTMDGLKNASGFIRTELAQRVNLRYTPELVFELDDTMEYGVN